MKLRTCEYCGTEYDNHEAKCPVCGSGSSQEYFEHTDMPKKRTAGARAAKKKGNGPWGAISAILGVLVIGGIVMFFLHMDFFREGGFDFNAIPTKLVEYNYENQTPTANPETEQPVIQAPVEVQPSEQTPVVTDPDSKACTGLTISQNAVVMDEAGGRIFLTAVARPSDCEDPIVFASSDEHVVTVTENGMITAVAPGVADIVVTCGSVTKICTVECVFPEEVVEEEVPVEDIPEEEEPAEEEETETDPNAPSLNNTDFTLFYPGEEFTLTVQNAPQGAAITYVSSNTGVVTVDSAGKVVAKGDGDATITVMVGDIKLTSIARCRMDDSAEEGADGSYTGPFTISHTDVTLRKKGETFTLSLTDAAGKKVTGLTWTASNGAATVSGNTVKAAIAGQTLVSCVYDGTTYSCIVRCNF